MFLMLLQGSRFSQKSVVALVFDSCPLPVGNLTPTSTKHWLLLTKASECQLYFRLHK